MAASWRTCVGRLSRVARQVIAAGERPRLLVRDPDKARAFANTADVVRGDLDDVASVRGAMRGIEGVTHVVKLSVISAEAPAITFARWHNEAEQKLKASGLAWTMLRPGNFMTNALGWAPTIKAEGNIYQPTGTGTWAAIDPADIGAVAVRALTGAGHEGKEYTLTGAEALDGAGYAAILGRPATTFESWATRNAGAFGR